MCLTDESSNNVNTMHSKQRLVGPTAQWLEQYTTSLHVAVSNSAQISICDISFLRESIRRHWSRELSGDGQ